MILFGQKILYVRSKNNVGNCKTFWHEFCSYWCY